jgi:hypothetical protein
MIDFKRTSSGDIDLSSGDLQFGNMSAYHKKDIIIMKQGDLKHAPTLGVQIYAYINEDDTEKVLLKIRKNFRRDEIKIVSLSFNNNILSEQSYYEED